MAFRILDNEEAELLNDQQKEQYKEKLTLYQQRVDFVEQIEILEKVNIEPYAPKLESINVIEVIDFMSFQKPEYKLTICEPAEKPEIKVNSFEKLERPKPVLPTLNKKPKIMVKQILKINKIQPNLPGIRKPSMEMRAGQVKFNRGDILNHMPSSSMPEIPIRSFVMPAADTSLLPKVSISYADAKTFQKPEKTNIELPIAASPNLNINSYQEIKLEQPDLPKVPKIGFEVTVAFQKPELSQIEPSRVERPDIEIRYSNKRKSVKPKLPKVSGVKSAIKNFNRLEPVQADVPSVNKVNIEIKSFEKPINNPVLPTMDKIRMIDKDFIHIEKFQVKMLEVDSPYTPVKTFVRPETAIPTLPERSTNQIPGIDKKIAELLSVMNKKYHTLIG